jgi:hypothetical protein
MYVRVSTRLLADGKVLMALAAQQQNACLVDTAQYNNAPLIVAV